MNQTESNGLSPIREAIEDVAHNGRQLLVNQFALVGAEAREGLDRAVNRLIEAFTAILLGFLGFVILTMAGVHLLELQVGRPAAYGIVGGTYVVISYILARLSAGKNPITGNEA